ncbi:hypothetical protein E2C01_007387 [Portunus trituberculatus]|uniref:Uncharacterized protein n=1 Tax=Portunus trituberculatus TaxID=210409 RepID=A0A5B7CZ45_PORTR|nr:hypothetical protein [Portunus trituberculatus]
MVLRKKVKTPVVILIVIWQTETNPHSDIHKPPHVLPTSNALFTWSEWCGLRCHQRPWGKDGGLVRQSLRPHSNPTHTSGLWGAGTVDYSSSNICNT